MIHSKIEATILDRVPQHNIWTPCMENYLPPDFDATLLIPWILGCLLSLTLWPFGGLCDHTNVLFFLLLLYSSFLSPTFLSLLSRSPFSGLHCPYVKIPFLWALRHNCDLLPLFGLWFLIPELTEYMLLFCDALGMELFSLLFYIYLSLATISPVALAIPTPFTMYHFAYKLSMPRWSCYYDCIHCIQEAPLYFLYRFKQKCLLYYFVLITLNKKFEQKNWPLK